MINSLFHLSERITHLVEFYIISNFNVSDINDNQFCDFCCMVQTASIKYLFNDFQKVYIHPWIISPTYSLGGVSCLSGLFPGARLLALSSSVLLVSTISVSSVEITCCCLRGFFLGEAPGRRSPGWEDMARVEAWEERDGAGPVEEGAMGTAKKRTHKYIVISLFSCIPPLYLVFQYNLILLAQ